MRAAILTAVLIGLALPPAAKAEEPITKREARRGSPADVQQKMLHQVGDLMTRETGRSKAPLRTSLELEPLSTVARSTAYQGLCRTDVLWIEFSKAGSTGAGPDEPRRASGFTSTSYFSFVAPPPATVTGAGQLLSKRIIPPDTGPCKGDDGGFRAEDADMAAEGYLLFRRVLAEAPTAAWPVDCQLQGDDKADCRVVLSQLRVTDLARISDCGPFRESWGETCTDFVATNDTIIRVMGTAAGQDSPVTIKRVRILEQLILYHQRAYD
jgi:hypothetical protein